MLEVRSIQFLFLNSFICSLGRVFQLLPCHNSKIVLLLYYQQQIKLWRKLKIRHFVQQLSIVKCTRAPIRLQKEFENIFDMKQTKSNFFHGCKEIILFFHAAKMSETLLVSSVQVYPAFIRQVANDRALQIALAEQQKRPIIIGKIGLYMYDYTHTGLYCSYTKPCKSYYRSWVHAKCEISPNNMHSIFNRELTSR